MADVASDLKTWSTTASSNSPADATVIGAGLADNFQEIQKVVRQDLAHKGADIASAATTDLGAVVGLMHDITGTVTITSFGTVSAGIWKIVKFEGALTLTHNATSLILPGGQNITTVNGDVGIFMSEGSGNWRCLAYLPTSNAADSPLTSGRIPYVTTGGRLTDSANLTFDGSTIVTLTGANGTSNSTLKVENTSNTAIAAHSIIDATVGGTTSVGDPQLRLTIPGGTSWHVGVDNSVADLFCIGTGTAVGTNTLFSMNATTANFNVSTQVQTVSSILLNDTSNANVTMGLTINQGSADDQILSLKSSDVAHGITSIAETDTFAGWQKVHATNAGVQLYGFSLANQAIRFEAIGTTDNTTKTTAGSAPFITNTSKKSGTSSGANGADANLVAFQADGTTRFIFDNEGSAHADVEWIAFDDHDDLAVMESLEAHLAPGAVQRAFGDIVKYDLAFFEREKLLSGVREVSPGRMRGMLNTSRAHMLEMGTIRQLAREMAALKSQVNRLENRNA